MASAMNDFSNKNKPLTIGIVGYGNMGGAIGTGLLHGDKSATVVAVNNSSALSDKFSGEDLAEQLDFINKNQLIYGHPGDQPVLEAMTDLDLFIIGVKPKEEQLRPLMEYWPNKIPTKAPTMHIMAGTLNSVPKSAFGEQRPYIRLMPNTPVAIGEGMTGAYADPSVDDATKALVQKLMRPVSTLHWVEHEEDMNAVTALSGSGPAYVFYWVEYMSEKFGLEEQAVRDFLVDINLKAGSPEDHDERLIGAYWDLRFGLDEVAKNIARQNEGPLKGTKIFDEETASMYVSKTIKGAITMLRDDKRTAQQLRASVTSKDGTTQRAIEETLILEDLPLIGPNALASWGAAILRAQKRGYEIEKNLEAAFLAQNNNDTTLETTLES